MVVHVRYVRGEEQHSGLSLIVTDVPTTVCTYTLSDMTVDVVASAVLG